MRLLAYGLICAGLLWSASAAYDEYRGVTRGATRAGSILPVGKATDPAHFRNVMTYRWLRAGGVVLSGCVLLGFLRRMDRLDPLSPDCAGLDEAVPPTGGRKEDPPSRVP